MRNRKQHAAKPRGIGGKRTLKRMNGGAHAALSAWGLSHLILTDYTEALEIGCGGGANVARLLSGNPDGQVTGIDYSNVSVRASKKENAAAMQAGRCRILQGNVKELPFADESFDLATAFETIYFWPDIADSFREVARVLRGGGTFFICNETDGEDEEGRQWEQDIAGMKVYTVEEVAALLRQAGFAEVTVTRETEKHWVCFLARKEAAPKEEIL